VRRTDRTFGAAIGTAAHALVAGATFAGLAVARTADSAATQSETVSVAAAPDRSAAETEGLPDAVEGARAYSRWCAPCHGREGRGDGAASAMLDPRPLDFSRGLFKLRSTPTGVLPLEEDLFRTVTRGIPGTSMPSFGRLLSVRERAAAVRHLRSITPTASAPAAERMAIPATPDSIDSHESTSRGAEVYRRLECAVCHGVEGTTPRRNLGDAWKRPILPRDFRRRFKGGDRPEEIYRTLVTGMDGTPMESVAGKATPEEIWDLVSFVRSLHHSPYRVNPIFLVPDDAW
jgi:mono/diheme cytochrome c family protein